MMLTENILNDSRLLALENNFGGVDTSRFLASSVTSYTATEDCFVYATISQDSWGVVNKDRIPLLVVSPSKGNYSMYVCQLKKGDTVTSSNCYLNVYGVKR